MKSQQHVDNLFKAGAVLLMILGLLMYATLSSAAPIIIDHTCTDITQIPEDAILQAKSDLHIAYGHTSHGSQLTTGMSSLVAFMNGLGYPNNLYAYNNGGSSGALDLRDTPFSGASDLGNPDRTSWATATRNYLDSHTDVNVIIWSWCGQVSSASESDIDTYLSLMDGLEADYPGVMFVYMTGHLDGGGAFGNLNVRNQQIRDYCQANDKILYDFADIESYDPDGLVNYMSLSANDNCDYDSDANGSRDRNWATDWQDAHTQNIDWYSCSSAHSQPLNANRKAYGAWWLWAKLAGWGGGQCAAAPSGLTATADSVAQTITLGWIDNSADPQEDAFIIQRQMNGGGWDTNYATVPTGTTSFVDAGLALGDYDYRVAAHLNDDGSGDPCDSGPSAAVSASIITAIPPEAPVALTGTGDSLNHEITLLWMDYATNESGFRVQRRVNGGPWDDNHADLPADSTTFIDQNLDQGFYAYRVVAYNAFGEAASDSFELELLVIPLAPTDLDAIGDSLAGQVWISWIDNASSETGFTIERQIGGGAWDSSYDLVAADETAYTDDNHGAGPLGPGTYAYRVAAINGLGQSDYSNVAAAVITQEAPEAPLNLVSDQSGFDVTLTWVDRADNEENYVVERKIDDGQFVVLNDTLAPDTQTYGDTGLAPLHTYTYRVMARNNFGDSSYSNETDEYIAEEVSELYLKQGVDGYEGCRDAYLVSASSTYNYGGDYYNYVRHSPKINLAIAFDLPEEVCGKKILSATLGFYCWSVSSWSADQALELYRLTENWVEGTADGTYQEGSVSWDIRSGQSAWSAAGGTHDTEVLGQVEIPSSGFYPEFDITDLVQGWADCTTPNYGVLLKNNTSVSTGIKASEYSEYGRPYLEISYTVMSNCGDKDQDGDVDGSDLAALAADSDTACLADLAAAYGR